MTAPLPALRPELDIFPSPDPDRPGFVLRDPYQYTDVIAVVPTFLASVLPFFDGEHTELELRTYLTRMTGELEVGEVVRELVDSLASAGFLFTEQFEEMRRSRQEEFRGAPERLPAHEGSAYPDDPDELRQFLRETLAATPVSSGSSPSIIMDPAPSTRPDDPRNRGALDRPGFLGDRLPSQRSGGLVDAQGMPIRSGGLVDASGAPIRSAEATDSHDARGAFGSGPASRGPDRSAGAAPDDAFAGAAAEDLLAIAAPHVSPEGGWASYAAAYRNLGPHLREHTFIVLGTSHYGEPERFGLTRKSFRTPLGLARTDRELVDRLEREAGDSIVVEDYCHAIEHSIEFQVLFLQQRVATDVKILPILCGPFQDALLNRSAPESDRRVGRFLDALGRLAESAAPIFWILGVDLAHVGARYGDPLEAVAEEGPLREVRARDLARLDRVASADAAGFLELVQPNYDDLKWCGFAPLYTFLKAQPGAPGRLWRYEQWNIDEASVVSFAAMGFQRAAAS